jgi:aryl carrier-like protein
MLEYLQQGYIQPIRPTKIFGAAAIQESFRYMQKGQHIGKIVVALRNTDTTTKLDMTESNKNRKKTFQLDQEASYLLIGGLGGLGRAISTWMVEHGARHLIYLSRNAGLGLEDQSFFRELESLGCEIQVVKGSVSSPEDVRQAVNEANKPLKGILQMSLVLRDQAFPRMTYDEWNAATSAKVQGTWNLHHATRAAGANLDFFVLFSSISGVIGQPGQANYASANTFLDAFVQYRTNLNLPASAIDIGAVEDVGYVARNEGLLRKMKTANVYGLREQELLDALMLAMIPRTVSQSKSCSAGYGFMDPNQFVLGLCSTIPLSNPANRSIWKNDRRMAVYHNSVNAANAPSTASSNVLNSFLATARGDASILKAPESSTILANEIGKKLFDFLLKPEEDLDLTRPLAEIGMDSLIAIEMKSWWKQVFGSDISVLEMLATGTLEALGRHAAASLLKMAEEESGELGS